MKEIEDDVDFMDYIDSIQDRPKIVEAIEPIGSGSKERQVREEDPEKLKEKKEVEIEEELKRLRISVSVFTILDNDTSNLPTIFNIVQEHEQKLK